MNKALYHIHVDAEYIAPQFEEYVCQNLGFWVADFLHESQYESWEPQRSLTYKTDDSQDFKRVFISTRKYAKRNPGQFVGYIEGEFIACDMDIVSKEFDPSIKLPFKVHTKLPLPAQFREGEIHVCFLKKQSDSRLQQALEAMGLHPCYTPKQEGVMAVLTCQGSLEQIGQLLPKITTYLQEAGGGANCSIKEEHIAEWWMSDPGVKLHPIVDHIEW